LHETVCLKTYGIEFIRKQTCNCGQY